MKSKLAVLGAVAALAAFAVSAPAEAGYYGYGAYGAYPAPVAPVVVAVPPTRIVCNAWGRCWRQPVYAAPVPVWPHRHRHWGRYRGW